ncbi:hypothetical protein Aduo_011815 [Ancylostoma duodenale]
MLHAKELEDSRAMASAQIYYEKCLTSDNEWEGKGGSIAFVMEIIRGYGQFPLIDGSWDEETFNLTKLLAYFNRNKTINHGLVPRIKRNERNASRGSVVFTSEEGVFTRVAKLDNERIHTILFNVLLNFTMQICIDTKSQCERDTIEKDIEDFYLFTMNLEKIHVHGRSEGQHRYLRKFRHMDKLTEVVSFPQQKCHTPLSTTISDDP